MDPSSLSGCRWGLALFVKWKSAGARAHYRQTLLVSGSLCVLSALAPPALAQCASGNGQLTGPGSTCNTPQTLTGTNTAGTVATGWTLSTGASDAYNVSGPGDVAMC